MNVMICNKYKELLKGLNIEIMKSLEGVYNVDELIDTFTNFYFDKMILDITSIRDYQNVDNLQKLAMNINMENVILLLDDVPETNNPQFISKLISLGIYNFTKNVEGINYLIVHPHTLKDVVNIHNIQELDERISQTQAPVQQQAQQQTSFIPTTVGETTIAPSTGGGKLKIIGFKNVTNHAGATSLIYMLKKALQTSRSVNAIEINKVDFLYFNDPDMASSNTQDVLKEIMKRQVNCDIILLDLNDYEDTEICTEVYYLIEPSTIMINKMLRKNKGILESLRDKKVVLNKCVLNSEDVATFEYETKLKVLYAIPALDDRQENNETLIKFINKIGL